MAPHGSTYRDRFGHEWSISEERKRGTLKGVTFTCGEFVLVADADEITDKAALTSAQVKDLFCDAERALVHDGEKWYVGFRTRMGRGGRVQGGIHTRFRSADGEVRYAKGMLHFRHMREDTLCEHLVAAKRAAG